MACPRALLLAFCAVLGAATTGAWAAGDARWRKPYPAAQPDEGYVVAESRFGHGTVSGPVRRARWGYEVRMPGGTWIACRRSCAETLRVETVDFWENRGAGRNAIDNECGIFGCLTWSRRF